MAFGNEYGCGLVIDDFVCVEDVATVVGDYVSIECEFIAHVGLPVRIELNGIAGIRLWLGLRNG
jgi:hypothetical protein